MSELILEWSRPNITVLMVEHNLTFLRTLCGQS